MIIFEEYQQYNLLDDNTSHNTSHKTSIFVTIITSPTSLFNSMTADCEITNIGDFIEWYCILLLNLFWGFYRMVLYFIIEFILGIL